MDLHRSPAPTAESSVEKIDRLFARLGSIDHYTLLGVPREAETQLIQSAHSLRRTLFRTLPTGTQANTQGAKTRAIVAAMDHAWETLRDPVRRAAYDRANPPATRPASVPPERTTPVPQAAQPVAAPTRTNLTPTASFSARPAPQTTPVPVLVSRATTPIPARVLPSLPEARMPVASGVAPAVAPAEAPRPARVTRTTPTPSLMARDPWSNTDLSETSLQDEVEALSSALQLVLGALAERSSHDPLLDDARHELAYLQTRRTVRQAREHEAAERWSLASRAWMRAATACPDDAWLLAHAARALACVEPSSPEVARLARRSLALDETNVLARQVLARAA